MENDKKLIKVIMTDYITVDKNYTKTMVIEEILKKIQVMQGQTKTYLNKVIDNIKDAS